ncbi:hypothetical protein CBR_g9089 [Chara braunii]|uniref:Uncharacterized protein n=1 Tax=Chara braunii TaxID=69332 RepID=A0A388KNR4_CHABU|nr:hypothetical protein CBR_g9089 [Chara braunii]|eukprot:GBG71675.1 hypothetical protein CBR_g9089 [Chara braunii]
MCSECFFYFGCPFVCPSSGRDYSSSGDLRMREDDLRARSSSGEVRSVDFRSGELRSGELRSGELRMGGDFRSGELRSGELRSGEVRVRGDSGYPGLWTEIMLGQSDGDWERDSGEVRELPDSLEAESLRVEVISLLEAAATLEGITFNQRECLALMSTLYKCALVPSVAAVLARCLHRVLQLAVDATVDAMLQYDMTTMLSRIMMKQHETHSLVRKSEADEAEVEPQPAEAKRTYRSNSLVADQWWQARTTVFTLFKDYIALSDEARVRAGQNETAINVLFELLWEPNARKFALRHILTFMKRLPQLGEDRAVKLSLFGKYLEALPRAQVECRGSGTIDILNDLLEGIQDVLQVDLKYYQGLFAEGECFVQIVSVLNSEHSFEAGSKLTLNVIKTLTKLLSGNDTTKAVFRNLVGAGYHTLSKVIIERHHGCPSRELLGALLDMLVDGRFDVRSNMVIQNEDVVPLFFGVLRKCDVNLQLEGLDTFQALLDECTSNRACCVRAGLVGILLEWFPSIEDDILLDKVAILVRMSGGHSVSGKDMRVVFGLLRSTREGCRPRHATALLRTLQSMVAGEGPAVFYEFSGRESGISLSSPLRWPVSKGYTFCCWLRVEHFLRKDHAGSVYDGAMGLFSFTIDRGKGSDHMKGCTALIFESGLSVQTHGSKAQTVRMDFQFRPKRWYFVVVAHSVSRLVGGSNIKFYVDGNLVTSEKLRYPKINDPVTRCTIAAKAPLPLSEDCENNEDMAPHKMSSAFRGQLGPIYLFDDALSSNQVAGVARLGPGYMYSFLPNESGCVPENVSVHGIMDGKDGLAPRMVFGFNAQASSGKTCFNISALLDQGSDQLPCDATIMEGTQVCCTRRVQDIIHCVGGITVLFPLFTQLDQPVVGSTEAFAENKSGFEEGHKKQGDAKGERRSCFHEAVKGSEVATARSQMEYKVDQYLAVEVIGLLAAVLAGNLANQQYMLNMAGFAVVGFLLQRVSPQHLTVNVVHALERLIGSVANSPAPSVADALVKEALSKLYLDPRIWVYTPFEVQKELYQSLLRQVDHDPGRLRITCGLQRVLDIVRQFYWDKPCSSQSYATRPLLHPVTHIRIGERPSSQEVAKLRTMVLGLADRMFRENVSLVEVKALVAFIEKGIDNSLIEDVLRCVLSVLNYKGPALAAMVEHVFALGGCQIFLSILKRDQESIRLLGLRLIGTILTATPVEKRVGRVNTGSSGALAALERIRGTEKASISTLFAAIGENISFFPFTEALRTTLFELMLGGASQKQFDNIPIRGHPLIKDRLEVEYPNNKVLKWVLPTPEFLAPHCDSITAVLEVNTDTNPEFPKEWEFCIGEEASSVTVLTDAPICFRCRERGHLGTDPACPRSPEHSKEKKLRQNMLVEVEEAKGIWFVNDQDYNGWVFNDTIDDPKWIWTYNTNPSTKQPDIFPPSDSRWHAVGAKKVTVKLDERAKLSESLTWRAWDTITMMPYSVLNKRFSTTDIIADLLADIIRTRLSTSRTSLQDEATPIDVDMRREDSDMEDEEDGEREEDDKISPGGDDVVQPTTSGSSAGEYGLSSSAASGDNRDSDTDSSKTQASESVLGKSVRDTYRNEHLPYTVEQDAKAAAVLKERREEEAKKKALIDEQVAKLKKIEEEMAREKKRLKKEEEEKPKAVEEEEEIEEPPLERRRTGGRGESSGTKEDQMEKKITEWVVGLSLGEEEEALMYVPREEQEAAMREWDAEEDPLKRQAIADEKRMEWKSRLTREKKRRMEAASQAAKELEEDLLGKMEIMARNIERLAQVQEGQYLFGRGQDIALRSIRLGLRDFARELATVKASDRLQTIHSRQWKSARALKGVMDELVAIPDHGVTETQLVNLYYRAMPEQLCGHFFEKSQQPTMTCDALSREVVAFEAWSMSISTFWHKDLDKGKKWKGRTILGQVKTKDRLILTLDEGGVDEVPYEQIEWGLDEEDSSVSQGRTYAAVAAGGRPQGGGRGEGQGGRASGGRSQSDQGVGGRGGNRQALDASHVLDASHEQMHGTWQATSQSLETLTGSCPQLLARSPRILAGAPTMPSLKTTPPDMELPAVMGIICKFLRGCEDYQLHIDILKDIAHLVVENSHNRELLIQGDPVYVNSEMFGR